MIQQPEPRCNQSLKIQYVRELDAYPMDVSVGIIPLIPVEMWFFYHSDEHVCDVVFAYWRMCM